MKEVKELDDKCAQWSDIVKDYEEKLERNRVLLNDILKERYDIKKGGEQK